MKSLTTSKFMVQILKSEKKAFHYYEVEQVNVPHNRYTSKKSIAKMISQHPDLAKYFPDDPANQCDRQFMLDILNTVDPAFFAKVMQEYEAATLKQATKSNKTITLDDSMYGVLSQYADLYQSRSAKAAGTMQHEPTVTSWRPLGASLGPLRPLGGLLRAS